MTLYVRVFEFKSIVNIQIHNCRNANSDNGYSRGSIHVHFEPTTSSNFNI